MKTVVITVEVPQDDPITASFSDDAVEEISLSTYPLSKWNTEGLENAVSAVTEWLEIARSHEREEVRAWMKSFITDQLSYCASYEFEWDPEELVLIAARESHGNAAFSASAEIEQYALAALSWSYDNVPVGRSLTVDRYALLALRAIILNRVPNAIAFHLDYSGDEDGGMYVDEIILADGTVIVADNIEHDDTVDQYDEDGEIQRAASDITHIESLTHDDVLITRKGRSDYRVELLPAAD